MLKLPWRKLALPLACLTIAAVSLLSAVGAMPSFDAASIRALKTQYARYQPAQNGVSERSGVLPWKVLARVKPAAKGPNFDHSVLVLDQQPVTLEGFMLPLEPGEQQKHFLVGAHPPSCPYCFPGGPDQMVEVKASSGVEYSYDPVLLQGKLLLLRNAASGLYYQLVDARQL